MTANSTFSESWYRVATMQAALRPTVTARRQVFRGQEWIILEDPFNNQFFRLHPDAYGFVSHLELGRSVEQVWEKELERNPTQAPGQAEVIQILTQLHGSSLLYYNTDTDTEQLFERHRKRKRRELNARLLGIMFARIPLYDPDVMLKQLVPITGFLFNAVGLILWLGVVITGGKVALDNATELMDQAQSVLAPSNMILLYASMVVIKVLHEFGHALTCRHYGGEVHVMGMMLIVFTPLPYMDATSSWGFRNRWPRILVGGAGMVTELFIAAIAALVWANTGAGVVHSVAYNMMFIASVSTLLFNAMPLLKFDGYYILADLVDIPNLYQRSQQQLQYLFKYYLFGIRTTEKVANDTREAIWLVIYGALSLIYRMMIYVGIVLFVGDQYLILGILMAFMMVFAWMVVPPYKLLKYLSFSPTLVRNRRRACWTTGLILSSSIVPLALIPVPDYFRAPGVVQSVQFMQANNDVSGYLVELLAPSGSNVTTGQPLMRLENWQLNNDLRVAQAQLRQLQAEEQQARSRSVKDLEPIIKRRQNFDQRQQQLILQQEGLTIRAQQTGLWVAPKIKQSLGSWLNRGTPLGLLVSEEKFEFIAIVPQDEASNLFNEEILSAQVRFHGQVDQVININTYTIIPYQQDRLPTAALGWRGGGDIEVSMNDEHGTLTAEPFFRFNADFPSTENTLKMHHGRTGLIRLTLSAKPLLQQWLRDVRQILQKRYQI